MWSDTTAHHFPLWGLLQVSQVLFIEIKGNSKIKINKGKIQEKANMT